MSTPAATTSPCFCLDGLGIFTCDECCNSTATVRQLMNDSALFSAPELLRTDPAPCADCYCIPCFCASSNYVTSSRTTSAATETANTENAQTPTPSPAETSPLANKVPVLNRLPDHLMEDMNVFMAAAALMFAEHQIDKIGDTIYDTWADIAMSRHKTWNAKLDAFHLALHKCNYMMHVTDDIMDAEIDYTFEYFKASSARKRVKFIMASLIRDWSDNYTNYLACSAESQ